MLAASWLLLLLGGVGRARPEQDRHRDRRVHCSSSRARASPPWGTPAWRSTRGCRASTTTRRPSARFRRPERAVHAQRVARGHQLRLRRRPRCRCGYWGTFFASVTALNSGDIEVRTVDAAAGHRRALHRLRRGRRRSASAAPITDRFAAGVQVNYVSGDDLAQQPARRHRQRRHGLPADRRRPAARRQHHATSARRGSSTAATWRSSTTTTRTATATTARCPGERSTDEFPVPVLFRLGLSYPRQLGERRRACCLVARTPSTPATTPRA